MKNSDIRQGCEYETAYWEQGDAWPPLPEKVRVVRKLDAAVVVSWGDESSKVSEEDYLVEIQRQAKQGTLHVKAGDLSPLSKSE